MRRRYRFIKPTEVRRAVNEQGKRVGRSFLLGLDGRVQRAIAVAMRNAGSAKTLKDDDLIRT